MNNMKTTTNTTQNSRQAGFVAILVTMILMVITSLIVLSFAFLTRQNQTRNLNNQLSTQAFYAAESGVNVAAAKLRAGTLSDSTDCSGTSQLGNQEVGTNQTTYFTCVLVGKSPKSLEYNPISTEKSTVVHIRTNAASNPTLLVSWESTSPRSHIFVSDGEQFRLPQEEVKDVTRRNDMSRPGGTGMLRATIIPVSAISDPDPSTSLLAKSRNYFLYPVKQFLGAPGTITDTTTDGLFGRGNCSLSAPGNTNPRECNTKITLTTQDFYLRLKAIYSSVNVTIQVLDGSNQPQAIEGAQAVIDSTGRSLDVVRRIQVRTPLTPSAVFPEFALETTDTICKRFSAYPGGTSVIAPKASLYAPSSTVTPNTLVPDLMACQLPS